MGSHVDQLITHSRPRPYDITYTVYDHISYNSTYQTATARMSLKDGFLFHWVLNTIHELRAVLVAVTCLQALTAVVKTAEGAPAGN